jgi:hypothetical protein
MVPTRPSGVQLALGSHRAPVTAPASVSDSFSSRPASPPSPDGDRAAESNAPVVLFEPVSE